MSINLLAFTPKDMEFIFEKIRKSKKLEAAWGDLIQLHKALQVKLLCFHCSFLATCFRYFCLFLPTAVSAVSTILSLPQHLFKILYLWNCSVKFYCLVFKLIMIVFSSLTFGFNKVFFVSS